MFAVINAKPPPFGAEGCVADVVLIDPCNALCVVVPLGMVPTEPHTSQSPAVREIDVTFIGVPDVIDNGEPCDTVLETYSPTLPAFALLFVVVPTMPAVCDGVIVLLNATAPLYVWAPEKVPDMAPLLIVGLANVLLVNVSVVARPTSVSVLVGNVSVPVLTMVEKLGDVSVGVVNVGDVPNTSEPDPVSFEMTPASCAEVVGANCDRLPLNGASPEPQMNPVPVVQRSALLDVLQLGIANAVGLATAPVAFAITVFAGTGDSELAMIFDHAGAVLGPVETIACPAEEPAGLRS